MNINDFLFAPVAAKEWQQYQLWDGTYTYDDLLDWHEMATIRAENKQKVQEYYSKRNQQ